MPIDPSIILGVRPVQIQQPDPFEQYGRLQAIKGSMGQQELQALQTQQARQGIDDDQAVRGAYQIAAGDSARLRALLGERGQYKAIQSLDKLDGDKKLQDSTIGKNTAQADKAKFDVDMGKLQHGAALLNEAKDPQSFDAILRVGQMTGTFAPAFVEQAREKGYSPEFVTSLQNAGVTRAQQLEAQNRAAVLAETARGHNLTNAATIRGQDIGATTARRGQDMTQSTTIRGQDLTDRRERDVPLAGAKAQAGAYGRDQGEAQSQAQINLPTVTANAERGIKLIDDLIGTTGKKLQPGEKSVPAHPGFQGVVGATVLPGARFIPGTDAASFDARLDEIKGGAFMQAFQSLRGGGAITEKEGEKATQAITRMSRAQSEAEFVQASRELQDIMRNGVKKAQSQASPRGASIGGVLRQNPDGSYNYGAQ